MPNRPNNSRRSNLRCHSSTPTTNSTCLKRLHPRCSTSKTLCLSNSLLKSLHHLILSKFSHSLDQPSNSSSQRNNNSNLKRSNRDNLNNNRRSISNRSRSNQLLNLQLNHPSSLKNKANSHRQNPKWQRTQRGRHLAQEH